MNAEAIYSHQQWEDAHGYGHDHHIELDADEAQGARGLSRILGREVLISCLTDKYIAYDVAAEAGATESELLAKARELEVFHRALILSLSPETKTAA